MKLVYPCHFNMQDSARI